MASFACLPLNPRPPCEAATPQGTIDGEDEKDEEGMDPGPAGADGEARLRPVRWCYMRSKASRSRAITWRVPTRMPPWWCWCTTGDGLHGYEIKRAEMLVALGYSVFAVDLFPVPGSGRARWKTRSAPTGAPHQDRTRMRTLLQGGHGGNGQAGGRPDKCGWPSVTDAGGAAVLEEPAAGRISRGGERTRRAGDPGRAGLQRRRDVACPARQRRRGWSLWVSLRRWWPSWRAPV